MPVVDRDQSYDPPQDTGAPDQVETDPAALNSAEDLDEDRLRVDPLEEGMDPPEHWSGVNRYGTTPWEQRHARPLDQRLADEEPDVTPASPRDEDRRGITAEPDGEPSTEDDPDVPGNTVDSTLAQGMDADVAPDVPQDTDGLRLDEPPR